MHYRTLKAALAFFVFLTFNSFTMYWTKRAARGKLLARCSS